MKMSKVLVWFIYLQVILFVVKMIDIYERFQSEPAILIGSVFALITLELKFLSNIKREEVKNERPTI